MNRNLLLFLFTFAPLWVSAQKSALDRYIDSLRYDPIKIEHSIITVAQHEGLVKGTRELAVKTKTDFQEIVKNLPEQQQMGALQLMRRPKILRSYAVPNLSEKEIRYLFRNYPLEIQDRAVLFHGEQLETLVQLSNLQTRSQKDFEFLMMQYPARARQSMEYLIEFPQIMVLLTEDNATYRRLVKTHREQPDMFVYVVDSIAMVISKEHDRQLMEWKKQLESNPEALKEFERSIGIYEGHLEARKQDEHNQTMMAKKDHSKDVTAQQQAYFQQYGTRRDPSKDSNVHVSVWVGFGFGYGYPYWYGYPAYGYGAPMSNYYWNPYHNPYWF